jgi:hypothetical protein
MHTVLLDRLDTQDERLLAIEAGRVRALLNNLFERDADRLGQLSESLPRLYIAQKTGSYVAVNEYAQFLRETKPELWQSDLLEVVGGLGGILPSTGELPLEDISALIGDSVLLGAGIRLTDLLGSRRLALELDGGYAALVEPGRWLHEPSVIGAIIRRRPLSPGWLVRVVSFFQVEDKGYELATPQLTLRGEDRLLTQQGAVGNATFGGLRHHA